MKKFETPLHVGRPHAVDRKAFFAHIEDILDSGQLSNDGPKVHEFERRVCELMNIKHCISTCNGTQALQILAHALNLQGEVIVPSFTFIATAHALSWIGLTPVFADVDSATWTLDPHDVEQKITEHTSAILGVHLWGQPCRMDLLEPLAQKHNLHLIFDAAHAFACAGAGQSGNAEIFSFHATKTVSTFEGGAVVTNDVDLAHRLRQIRSFGFVAHDNVQTLGTNAKMSEVSAAMGLVSLDRLPQTIKENKKTYEGYASELGEGLQLRRPSDNYQWANVTVGRESSITRDTLYAHLQKKNVLARRYFYPGCHRMASYKSGELIVTEDILDRVLTLPVGAQVPYNDAAEIARYMREMCCA